VIALSSFSFLTEQITQGLVLNAESSARTQHAVPVAHRSRAGPPDNGAASGSAALEF